MISDAFFASYFDDISDQHEFNEPLLKWLISEGVFDGPINCFEDVGAVDIEIQESSHVFENSGLTVRAAYTAALNFFYVDRNGQDCSISTEFDLHGEFIFSEAAAGFNGDDLTLTYRLREALPTKGIKLLRCEFSCPEE